jgi:class 3 adenylate cyclase
VDKSDRITVLTTDIRNFTYHSRQYERERESDFKKRFSDLCEIVKDFHNLTLECAKRYDTQKEAIVLTAGDGLIIGFLDKKHVITAYYTALDLRKRYFQFFIEANRKMGEKRKSTALGYSIGIHTGKVVIEQYNSYHIPGALERIILGDALNISTRLESLTKDHTNCGILISEDTYKFLAEELGDKLDGQFVDYQVHNIRGYRPLRLYGISEDE